MYCNQINQSLAQAVKLLATCSVGSLPTSEQAEASAAAQHCYYRQRRWGSRRIGFHWLDAVE